jgi:membrane fusion protein (multidrug efflux system)
VLRSPVFTLLLFFLVFGCKEKKDVSVGAARSAGPPPVFEAVVAQSFQVNRDIQTPGSILPNESTDIHAEISGRVIAINFKEGAFVQQGALLVKLFDSDLQAQLQKLQVQLKIAETTAGRQQELLQINGTSQQDVDNAVLTVSNTKADIELMKVNIGKTEIRAPYAGRIGLRYVSLGAYVSPVTTITNLSQVNVLKVEFSVPEKYAGFMKPGNAVQLKTDGSSKLYTATVTASQNTIYQDTRNLAVRAIITNPDAQIRPGAFVQVNVNMGNNQPAIMVPTQAVIPSTRYKKVIIGRGGKAVFQNIETGIRDSSRVEIVTGIKAGDTIITNGLLTIKEGMPLKVAVKKMN